MKPKEKLRGADEWLAASSIAESSSTSIKGCHGCYRLYHIITSRWKALCAQVTVVMGLRDFTGPFPSKVSWSHL